MKKIIFLVLIFLSALVQSQPKQDVIWPLAVGNKWVFKHMYFNNLGGISSSNIEIAKIISDTIINNEIIYYLSYNSDSRIDTLIITNRKDGLWLNNIQDKEKGLNFHIKYPVKVGERFYNPGFQDTLFVDSTNVKVITNSGLSYICIQYSLPVKKIAADYQFYSNFFIKKKYYISPNVGFIKNETLIGNSIDSLKLDEIVELSEPPILK